MDSEYAIVKGKCSSCGGSLQLEKSIEAAKVENLCTEMRRRVETDPNREARNIKKYLKIIDNNLPFDGVVDVPNIYYCSFRNKDNFADCIREFRKNLGGDKKILFVNKVRLDLDKGKTNVMEKHDETFLCSFR